MIKNKLPSIQKNRFYIQLLFVVISLWIGFEFVHFIKWIESGGAAIYSERPPGVDAFLPISSMMNVYYFLLSGEINQTHPAGFFIFLGIVAISFTLGKSFCSWVCPVGFVSEMIGDFGDKISNKLFKRKLTVPKFLDYPLRSLKYLLLAFFVYSIFFTMTEASLKMFLDSTYNIVADVKMYYFFADISETALIVLSVLFFLSIVIRNFWCRYLCPYGALLGITSLLSPNKIKRNTDSCIDCKLCTKACPSNIQVHKIKTVVSDECSSCFSCVDACPVADTLEMKSIVTKRRFNKKYAGLTIVALYFAFIIFGVLTNNWQNKVDKSIYIKVNKNINSLGHPRSIKDMHNLRKEAEEKINERKNEKQQLKER